MRLNLINFLAMLLAQGALAAPPLTIVLQPADQAAPPTENWQFDSIERSSEPGGGGFLRLRNGRITKKIPASGEVLSNFELILNPKTQWRRPHNPLIGDKVVYLGESLAPRQEGPIHLELHPDGTIKNVGITLEKYPFLPAGYQDTQGELVLKPTELQRATGSLADLKDQDWVAFRSPDAYKWLTRARLLGFRGGYAYITRHDELSPARKGDDWKDLTREIGKIPITALVTGVPEPVGPNGRPPFREFVFGVEDPFGRIPRVFVSTDLTTSEEVIDKMEAALLEITDEKNQERQAILDRFDPTAVKLRVVFPTSNSTRSQRFEKTGYEAKIKRGKDGNFLVEYRKPWWPLPKRIQLSASEILDLAKIQPAPYVVQPEKRHWQNPTSSYLGFARRNPNEYFFVVHGAGLRSWLFNFPDAEVSAGEAKSLTWPVTYTVAADTESNLSTDNRYIVVRDGMKEVRFPVFFLGMRGDKAAVAFAHDLDLLKARPSSNFTYYEVPLDLLLFTPELSRNEQFSPRPPKSNYEEMVKRPELGITARVVENPGKGVHQLTRQINQGTSCNSEFPKL